MRDWEPLIAVTQDDPYPKRSPRRRACLCERPLYGAPVFRQLAAVPEEFALYGGTAIALHLGHRESVDFDFFGNKPLDPTKLVPAIPFLAGAMFIGANFGACRRMGCKSLKSGRMAVIDHAGSGGSDGGIFPGAGSEAAASVAGGHAGVGA
ncbi:MAG: nucleotidyl transferase AbiEii/AbiGii toxin family protein [Magnetococcales bacterium]|nr:nucleotidyl transferase AbiEii/AbiGii toxin family protein [Magnetococcales bacterium]